MIYPEMNSEQLNKFHKSVEGLKRRMSISYMPSTILVNDCLRIVKNAIGTSALLKLLVEESRVGRGDLTEEEKAEEAAALAEIEEREAIERAELIRELKPFRVNPEYWKDFRNLAITLVKCAEDSEESFDFEFENILINRYNKKVFKTENGEIVAYGKIGG